MQKKTKSLVVVAVLVALFASGLFSSASGQPSPEEEQAREFIDLMANYLGLSNHWVETASKPETAVFLAIEGIIEVYEERREKAKAIPHIERIVEKNADNRSVRNIARFKLRDLYKETGRSDKAIEQLELVIAENSR